MAMSAMSKVELESRVEELEDKLEEVYDTIGDLLGIDDEGDENGDSEPE